jgi:glucosyl-dolichyl phosphate glucuronosyltransferase
VSDVSVIVCTHRIERWPWLLECLDSLQRQTLAPREVIVVVDGKPEIRQRLDERNGPEIRLSTAQPSGLSEARNLGIARASGTFIAFLDDDAVADESWLQNLYKVLHDDTVAGAGGVSLPNWEGRKPEWMPEELLWTVGCSYRGMPTSRSEVRNVYGGSAVFRRKIFTQFGGFNSNLGRQAAGLAGCEETELCLRVRMRSRLQFVHEPSSVIHHRVPRSRQTARYVLSRCAAEGRSKAILRAVTGPGSRPLDREANYLTHTVPSGIAANIGRFLRGDKWGATRAGLILVAVFSTMAAYQATRIMYLLGRYHLQPAPEPAIPSSLAASHRDPTADGSMMREPS